MLKQELKHDYDFAGVLRSARELRRQLRDSETQVKVTITGGGGEIDTGDGVIAKQCEFDVTADDYDSVNDPFNHLVGEQGCDCSQPAKGEDGKWGIHCTCP